jgi:hypothetical protein
VYVPEPQSLHAELPTTSLYLPPTHAVHTPPSTPVYPVLQAQAVIAELVLGEFEFGGQIVHALAPSAAEYVPTAQFVHATLPIVDL